MGNVIPSRYVAAINSLHLEDVPDIGQNRLIVREALLIHLRMISCDFSSRTENAVNAARGNYVAYLQEHGFLSLISQMQMIRSALLHFDNIVEWDVFRTSMRVSISREVMHVCSTFFSFERCCCFRELNSFCCFLLKLNLINPDIGADAIADYIRFEENYFEPDDEAVALASRVNRVIRRWIEDFDPQLSELHFDHGTGATAVKANGNLRSAKTASMELDAKLVTFLCRKGDMLSVLPPSRRSLRSFSLNRVSRTITVPKTLAKRRVISMEPPTLMYFQQGIRRALYKHLERVDCGIHFTSTDANHKFARIGSTDGSYATLDLSAASDSVSLWLVKRAFRDTPLLGWLLATRSASTEIDGNIYPLKKFAPMGSALCFPIEAIIFAAICQCSVPNRGPSAAYAVYGDDLCVPTRYSDVVTKNLVTLGFKVNVDKSFSTGTFRESCGKEYYCGHDVTPLYYRPKDLRPPRLCKDAVASLSPQGYYHYVQKANELRVRGFITAALYLTNQVYATAEQVSAVPLRGSFDTLDSRALLSNQPNNLVFDRTVFRSYVVHLDTRSVSLCDVEDPRDALFFTLYANQFRNEVSEVLRYRSEATLVFCQRRTYL